MTNRKPKIIAAAAPLAAPYVIQILENRAWNMRATISKFDGRKRSSYLVALSAIKPTGFEQVKPAREFDFWSDAEKHAKILLGL